MLISSYIVKEFVTCIFGNSSTQTFFCKDVFIFQYHFKTTKMSVNGDNLNKLTPAIVEAAVKVEDILLYLIQKYNQIV